MNKRTFEYVSDLEAMLGDGDRALRGRGGEPVDLDGEVARISDRVTSHVPGDDGFIHSVHIYWSSSDILLLLAKIVQLQGEVERFKAAYRFGPKV